MRAWICICDTRQVHDIDELKQHLYKVWHGLGQSGMAVSKVSK